MIRLTDSARREALTVDPDLPLGGQQVLRAASMLLLELEKTYITMP